jgi:hypothetical protein
MKTGSLMFSVEISYNILSHAPTRRSLRGGEIFDIAICGVKRRKGGWTWLWQMHREEILFLNDRCGNVYENKGPLWKSGAEAGMFMKIKVVMR